MISSVTWQPRVSNRIKIDLSRFFWLLPRDSLRSCAHPHHSRDMVNNTSSAKDLRISITICAACCVVLTSTEKLSYRESPARHNRRHFSTPVQLLPRSLDAGDLCSIGLRDLGRDDERLMTLTSRQRGYLCILMSLLADWTFLWLGLDSTTASNVGAGRVCGPRSVDELG